MAGSSVAEVTPRERRTALSSQTMGMHSAAVFSVTLALLLLLSDLNAVNSKPMSLMKRHAAAARRTSGHVRQKRATFEDIFGDLTAQAPGILNEDRKCGF